MIKIQTIDKDTGRKSAFTGKVVLSFIKTEEGSFSNLNGVTNHQELAIMVGRGMRSILNEMSKLAPNPDAAMKDATAALFGSYYANDGRDDTIISESTKIQEVEQ